jgi:hypothetical protein
MADVARNPADHPMRPSSAFSPMATSAIRTAINPKEASVDRRVWRSRGGGGQRTDGGAAVMVRAQQVKTWRADSGLATGKPDGVEEREPD